MTNIRFEPSSGYILIKVTKEEDQYILTVQDPEKAPASQGIVVAIGAPKLHEAGGYYEAKVNVGDTIIFKPYGIDSLMLNDEEHRIISFDNVRGILKDEK